MPYFLFYLEFFAILLFVRVTWTYVHQIVFSIVIHKYQKCKPTRFPHKTDQNIQNTRHHTMLDLCEEHSVNLRITGQNPLYPTTTLLSRLCLEFRQTKQTVAICTAMATSLTPKREVMLHSPQIQQVDTHCMTARPHSKPSHQCKL
jgi:hypothetical protein